VCVCVCVCVRGGVGPRGPRAGLVGAWIHGPES
jgi:hypothetical protein